MLSVWLGKNRVFTECVVGVFSLESIDECFLEEVVYKLRFERWREIVFYFKSNGERGGVIGLDMF